MDNITQIEGLIGIAAEARRKAYAPYSKYRVGAAVLGSSGIVYSGANVENVSFGLTICAERVAIAKAVSEGEREIAALAIVVEGEIAMPCGTCRQFIAEFASGDTPIIAANTEGQSITYTLNELLPHAFKQFKSEGNI